MLHMGFDSDCLGGSAQAMLSAISALQLGWAFLAVTCSFPGNIVWIRLKVFENSGQMPQTD